jgi:hypothetical protein
MSDKTKPVIAFDELPENIRERIIIFQGSEEKARAWLENSTFRLGGDTPKEYLARPEGRGHFLDMTCNCRVQAGLDAFLEAEEVRRKAAQVPGIELNVPESADWSRDSSARDEARRVQAERGQP